MIDISRTPDFPIGVNMSTVSAPTAAVEDLMTGGRGRQRSHSYYKAEDVKQYGVQTETEETYLRPRSRYVFIQMG